MILAAVLLTSCGGGGGGSGNSAGSGTKNGSLSLSTTSLTFTAASPGATVVPQDIVATVSGVSSGTVYFQVYGTQGSLPVGTPPNSFFYSFSDTTVTSPTTGKVTITPYSSSRFGPGTYTGTVTVTACVNDPTCLTGQLAGSPQTVNITYQVSGLTISPASIDFAAVEGVTPAAQTLSLSGLSSQPAWTTTTTYSGIVFPWLTVTPSSGSSLPATITFTVAQEFLGAYSATVTATTADGLSLPIPVNYTVLPQLSLSASSVTFSAVTGNASLPASASISVSGAGPATGYYPHVSQYNPNTANWLNVTGGGSLPATLQLVPNTTNLTPGTYTATVSLEPNAVSATTGGTTSTGQSVTMNVTYDVVAATLNAAPTSVDLSYVTGISRAAPSQSLTLTSNLGATAWACTPTYDGGASNGWLTFPASGTTGVPAQLNTSVAGLAPGRYTAHLTCTAGGATTTIPVALIVRAAGVGFVAPYIGTSNVASTAILRGVGFTGATSVMFGTTAATAFAVVSDSEIDASYPAFAAGTYAVSVGTLPNTANLVVVNPPAYAYSATTRPAGATGVTSMVYDAERQGLYLEQDSFVQSNPAQWGPDQIDKYHFSGTGWVFDGSYQFGSSSASRYLAVTPDGIQLIKNQGNAIIHNTLPNLTYTTYVSSLGLSGMGNLLLEKFAMTNDGNLIGSATEIFNGAISSVLYRYDSTLRYYSLLAIPPGLTDPLNSAISASADGSHLLIARNLGPSPVYLYSALDGSFSATPASVVGTTYNAGRMALNRSGSRSVIETSYNVHTVFDAAFHSIGNLPTCDSYALAPSGDKAYTFVAGTPGVVHAFNLNVASGGSFAEIGTGTAIVDAPGLGLQMLVTPDGGSLIIAGDQHVVVLPAP